MARTYTLKKRAEQQAETRQRIVDAAIELHGSVGPARTTVSMIAERAGVQRHTFYAHFPDERSLIVACSGQHMAQYPVPDPAPWRAIADPAEQLRKGLAALYVWFEDNADVLGCVLRDAEVHPIVREVVTEGWGPPMQAIHAALGEKLSAKQQPMLAVALSFHTWRSLTREGGMKSRAAAELMAKAVMGVG